MKNSTASAWQYRVNILGGSEYHKKECKGNRLRGILTGSSLNLFSHVHGKHKQEYGYVVLIW